MRAAVLHKINDPVVIEEISDPVAPEGGVLVRLHAAALNQRDNWIVKGQYAKIRLPSVLGSDGAGEVVGLGAGVDPIMLGRRVVIHPSSGWGNEPRAQGKEFVILGMPEQGTLAEKIAMPLSRVETLPDHLSFREGAAFSLGGLTAWRSLVTRGELKPGEHVLVTGIGGGVATLALVLARALGAEVSVTSSSSEKLTAAKALGAAFTADYTKPGWEKELVAQAGRPPSLIIDSGGGDGLNQLISCVAPGGRIVIYGATRGKPKELDVQRLFFKQIDLRGSTMGSEDEFRAFWKVVDRERIRPVIDSSVPLAQIGEAMARMEKASQMGKIVIDL